MTTCLAHATSLQHPGDRRTRETASTPTRKPAVVAGSKNLLRMLTGADGIKLPHHPRRRLGISPSLLERGGRNGDELAPKTEHEAHMIVRSALNDAVDCGLLRNKQRRGQRPISTPVPEGTEAIVPNAARRSGDHHTSSQTISGGSELVDKSP